VHGEILWKCGEAVEANLVRLSLPLQVVHGAAHAGNILMSTQGSVWVDWEEAFLGPREWDAACILATPVARQRNQDLVRQIAEVAGFDLNSDSLARLIEARIFQACVWSMLWVEQSPDRQEHFNTRMFWLRKALAI
jgi:thiamine kinase-like enzyme